MEIKEEGVAHSEQPRARGGGRRVTRATRRTGDVIGVLRRILRSYAVSYLVCPSAGVHHHSTLHREHRPCHHISGQQVIHDSCEVVFTILHELI